MEKGGLEWVGRRLKVQEDPSNMGEEKQKLGLKLYSGQPEVVERG